MNIQHPSVDHRRTGVGVCPRQGQRGGVILGERSSPELDAAGNDNRRGTRECQIVAATDEILSKGESRVGGKRHAAGNRGRIPCGTAKRKRTAAGSSRAGEDGIGGD